ncbi:MAG: hydroxymethylglutaryl-CoA reductase, degradative [Gammaproteobacteria bacterium]
MNDHPSNTRSSRVPGLYRLNVAERRRRLADMGIITQEDVRLLESMRGGLTPEAADRMIENVIGVAGLPLAIAPNFLIDGHERVVPMAVEEPSIVAALSSAARLVRESGGFAVQAQDPLLAGQLHIVGVDDAEAATAKLRAAEDDIVSFANGLQPNMVARGGGVRRIGLRSMALPDGSPLVVLHLEADTRDAMGANQVNTLCEGVAGMVERLTGGRVHLRILSNLTDGALVTASCSIPVDRLGEEGTRVRDAIVLANDIAIADPYRAATHNKGIMNGVDAVAIATGNDWRAIEAAAHAWASRDGRYSALTRWRTDEAGNLSGELTLPLKTGIVGGTLRANPVAAFALRLLEVHSARELSGILCAVGLAQNLSALKALATDGIQRGHMTLHARSVVAAAGAPPEHFDRVVTELVASGEIKPWKATELVNTVTEETREQEEAFLAEASSGAGKVILLGEHAVVYGRHALAAPLPLAVHALAQERGDSLRLRVPEWDVDRAIDPHAPDDNLLDACLRLAVRQLRVDDRGIDIMLRPHLPPAMGLGGSAAIAVAVVRSLDRCFRLGLDDEAVNELAFECEKLAHGTPSGVDNTVATYSRTLLYRREPPVNRFVDVGDLPLVVAMSEVRSLTSDMVRRVRTGYERDRARFTRLFDEIDQLVLESVEALEQGRPEELGFRMDVCQGILNALGVSAPVLEKMIGIARDAGAHGAKLTGAGGGGSIVAFCPDGTGPVAEALENAGFRTLQLHGDRGEA